MHGAGPYQGAAKARQGLSKAAFTLYSGAGRRGIDEHAAPGSDLGCISSEIALKRANIGHLSGINGARFGPSRRLQPAKTLEFSAFAAERRREK